MANECIALVTGASRGAGKGVAIGLGMRGYTVYVTGRSEREGDAALPGTIHRTAQEIDAAGGRGIAVHCDHADDQQVKALFDRIETDAGRLDILFNNATFIHDELVLPTPFWERSADIARILDVGLRSAFIASWHAARLMVPRRRGLIAGRREGVSILYRVADPAALKVIASGGMEEEASTEKEHPDEFDAAMGR